MLLTFVPINPLLLQELPLESIRQRKQQQLVDAIQEATSKDAIILRCVARCLCLCQINHWNR